MVGGIRDPVDDILQDALVRQRERSVVGTTFAENKASDVKQQRTTGGSAFYRVYDTSDGRQLVIAGHEMKFIKNLLGALGKPEMAGLCEWPGAHQKPVMDFLAETFRARPLAHRMEHLATLDICYGPVNTLPEAIAAANLQKRGFMVTDDDGRPTSVRSSASRMNRRCRSIASLCWVSIMRKCSSASRD